MKIYKHEIFCGRIETKEINVRETPKTYKATDLLYPLTISKKEIGVLHYGRMYSFSPNPRSYLKKKIEAKENEIASYEKAVETRKAEVEQLRKLLAETESEEEKCNE